MILLTKSPESPKASRKPPGSYNKIQGRNPGNNFVLYFGRPGNIL
jgi:hypothetical protein